MTGADPFEAAFPELLRTAARAAWKVLHDHSRSEDVASETMRRVFEQWATLDPARAPAWATRVARNLAVDQLRRRRHEPVAHPLTEDATDHVNDRLDLSSALSALAPRQREVIALKYFADLTDQQVATTLGLTVNTARTHLRRALQALRQKFDTDPESLLSTLRSTPMPTKTPTTWTIDTDSHPLGELVDRRTIRYQRRFHAPPAVVWDAIVGKIEPDDTPSWVPEGESTAAIGAWFIPIQAHLEPTLGGRFWFGDDDQILAGVVLALDEGREIVMSYRNGSGQIFHLAADDGGTELTFTHWLPAGFTLPQDRSDTGVDLGRTDNFAWNYQPGGPGSYQPALATAWHGSLLNLEIFVGGSLPEYRPGDDTWAEELYARYRDRFIDTMPAW